MQVNHFKIISFIVFPVCAAVFFLLLTVNHAWAGDADHLSSSGQNDVISVIGGTANDVEEDAWEDEWGEEDAIADPLEPLNRIFFHFNDKLYYWVLKPVAKVYSAITPEGVQISVRNFFDNLRAPMRVVNSLLQGQIKDASIEVARFGLNSTVGILGFGDFAKDVFELRSTREDTGQTLGYYGAGGLFYINWPFLGPSNFRDSLGMIGDAYLHPFMYLDADWEVLVGVQAFEKVNDTALTMGDYELFTETALDPYSAVKNAYQQHRNGLIKE